MGGVVDAITNVVCSVVSGVEDVVGTVADTAANTIEKALDDPIKTIAVIAAVASGNPELIPLINGTDTLIRTGNIEDALKSAAISEITQGVSCGLCIDMCGFCTPCCVDLCGICSPCAPCSPCMPCGGSLPDGCLPSTCLPSVDTPVCGAPTGGLPYGCTPSTCLPSDCMPCGSSCFACSCTTGCDTCIGSCTTCTPTYCAPTCCAPTCCVPCDACCAPCDCCDCCSCCSMPKIKKPKFPKNKKVKSNLNAAAPASSPTSTNTVKTQFMDPVLCGQASFLGNTGGGNQRSGMKKVNTGNINAGYMAPSGNKTQNFQVGENLGYCCASNNLGYAKGGKAEDDSSLKSILKDFNESLCEKKLHPSDICSKAEFMYQTGAPAKHCLSALKHLYPSIGGSYAKGGLSDKYEAAAPKGHNPEFITGVTGYYACGNGTGQSDDIPAMLHDGDYVMDAETVSALGDGSSKAGNHVLDGFRKQIPHKAEGGSNPVPAKIADGEYVFPASFVTALGGGDNRKGSEILDGLRTKLRAHKRGAPLSKIPPKAKDPIDYIKRGSK